MSPSAQNDADAEGIASRIRKRRRESAAFEETSNKRTRKAGAVRDQMTGKAAIKYEQAAPAPTSSETVVHASDLPSESQPSASSAHVSGGKQVESQPIAAAPLPDGEGNGSHLGRDITRAIRELVDLQYASRSKDTAVSTVIKVPDYGGIDPDTWLKMQSLPILENLVRESLATYAFPR